MKRYLIFVLLGPLIGGFILLLVNTTLSGYWDQTDASEVAKLFVVFFKTLQFTYLFGFLPVMMFAAIDDILSHVRRLAPAFRMLLVGVAAFFVSAFLYSRNGGLGQFALYGLVGLFPGALSSWLAHLYAERPVIAAA
jgi:hypothetical protein